jgi:hypothetical protein
MRYALATAVVLYICLLPAWALTAEQEAKLLPADGAPNQQFGQSVALHGDTAIIGGYDSNAAYVFIRASCVWTEQAKLLPADGASEYYFGHAVALDGDTAVIGAFDSGSAYVFTRTGSVWTQQAKLLPADGAGFFGWSVALHGDTAFIGAPWDGDNGPYSGSAYVFTRTAGVWTEQAKLLPADGAPGNYFGNDFALDGDTVVISAMWYGIDDDQIGTGSAYVFTNTGDVWTEQAKLLPADGATDDKFGGSVGLEGDTAFVGAYGDDDNGPSSGAVYVFTRTGSEWTEQAKLHASDGEESDIFGSSLALDGHTAVISALGDDANGWYTGSAYVFTHAGGVWTEQAKLLASDGEEADFFGASVALDGDTTIIGARFDDDNGSYSGSAYVFRLYDDDVPATSVVGLGVLLAAVLGTAYYFSRRRTMG